MVRRLLLGVGIGLLAAFLATPAEAAEWCLNDPALVFSAPHAHHITIYATEGVQGVEHITALHKSKLDFKAKPGHSAGTMQLEVRPNVPGRDHETFATLLIVSSKPYGAGTVYAFVMGSDNHDMNARFDLAYQNGG